MIPSDLLPSDMRWFIAGGWAACPALAADRDVWVRVAPNTLDAERMRILTHLRTDPWRDIREEDETRVTESSDGYEVKGVNIRKVATVWVGSGGPIHILVTDGHVEEVLRGFDVSTHQVAITSDGDVVVGDYWTPPQDKPVQLLHTEKTPDRMRKICQRFGHTYEETPVAAN